MKFFIGLLLGIGIAGVVAFYLNKAQNPFVDKGLNNPAAVAQSNSPGTGGNSSAPLLLAPGTKMQQANTSVQNSKNNASTPTYDFYDVLQGKKSIGSGVESANKKVESTPSYFVQVGAFDNSDLANNMKARLALLGFSAKIKAGQINNQIVNRVIMGPFDSESEARDLISNLQDQEIKARLVNE